MKRARLIYNPTSGKEQIRRSIPYILDRLERTGYETSAHATEGPGDGTDEARRAVAREFDLVVAAGGDGTIHEVVNGLAGQENRPTFGIIPMGTTNDLARSIGIPPSIEKACDAICEGLSIPVDVGKANDRYFIYVAGGGTLTELTYEAPSKLKTRLGRLAYYLKGIELLPQVRPTEVRIEYDGKLFEGEIMLFLIANSNSVSGFEKIAPDASLNDGMFELIIVKKTNLAGLVYIVQRASRGEHINDPHVIYTKASRIKVLPKTKMQLNLDGEFGGMFPCELSTLYRHLDLLVPEETAKKFS
ncbi:MAG TPA: diacylglycerol kinase [Bacillales bacterium]|nr:diacylglycerol kinase [Bacillales bacterium]